METVCGKTIQHGLARMRLALADEAITGLCRYLAELVKWNRKMNLVATASEPEILDTHFLDSLTLLPLLRDNDGPLLDIGTGAGFPGLVLKIALPNLAVALVEPRQKRVAFLRHIVRTLELKGITVHEQRIEPGSSALGREVKTFPLITGRAVSGIEDFLGLCEGFSPSGGRAVCMKGPRAEQEINSWRQNNPQGPYALEKIIRIALPFSGAERNLVVFIKQESL